MHGKFGHTSRLRTMSGYDVVRIAVGCLLLLAAGLKGHQLATEPVSGDGVLSSRWFLIGGVEFELAFGLWLWSGLSPMWTWRSALVCFGLFSGLSLFKAILGEASCGCFGTVAVNPWYTSLLDLGVFVCLFLWRPREVAFRCTVGSRAFAMRLVAISAIWLLVGLPGVVAMGTYQPSRLTDVGAILG